MRQLLADTNVWSLAFRSDTDWTNAHVNELRGGLGRGGVVATGVVYLELLRGFTRESSRDDIGREFDALPFVEPTRDDYAAAADLSIACRRAGVQLGAIDSLIAQVCIANDLTLLTADDDFAYAARHIPLSVWTPS